MIVISSDSKSSFDSIDYWKDLILSDEKNKDRPIFLVLVDKNQRRDE